MERRLLGWMAVASASAALAACDPNRESTANPIWTLYVVEGPGAQAKPFAKFDADDRGSDNRGACETVRAALQAESAPPRTYRCAIGRLRTED